MTTQNVRLKKGMSTFIGCDVGEKRLGMLKCALDKDKNLQKLIKGGFLSTNIEGSRIWLSLTSKGKDHVIPIEKKYSVL